MDESTFKILEQWAASEFRSVNGQIEWIIQQKLNETSRLKLAKNIPAELKKND